MSDQRSGPSFPGLVPLGWDSDAAEAFVTTAGDDSHLRPGRVASVVRGAADVLTPDECRAGYAAGLREAVAGDPLALPCPGDWVVLRGDPRGGETVIEAVLPRRTAIVRAGAGGDSHGQVLAAGVDTALVVEPGEPRPRLGRIERMLALAWASGATPVVAVTKADLVADIDEVTGEIADAAPGVAVHPVSALTGTGLDDLGTYVRDGCAVALLGPSGAGKSTLVNALAGAEVMATGAVRGDGRGRHTTVGRELIVLPGGGLVIDTPGLRSVGLQDAAEGVEQAFADITALADGCRFGDCGHDGEPGCAVRAAIDAGELPERRLASWRKLLREQEWIASRSDARLRTERTRRWKVIHKEMRRSNRYRP
jgi:ribosome biogenesis GTPase